MQNPVWHMPVRGHGGGCITPPAFRQFPRRRREPPTRIHMLAARVHYPSQSSLKLQLVFSVWQSVPQGLLYIQGGFKVSGGHERVGELPWTACEHVPPH